MTKEIIIIKYLKELAETYDPKIARAAHPEFKKILERDKLHILNLAAEIETGQTDIEGTKKK